MESVYPGNHRQNPGNMASENRKRFSSSADETQKINDLNYANKFSEAFLEALSRLNEKPHNTFNTIDDIKKYYDNNLHSQYKSYTKK